MFAISYILISVLALTSSDEAQRSASGSSVRSDYPFYIYLEVHSRTLTGYAIKSCSGTLLSNEWILTSAHCVKLAFRVQAHFGSYKVSDIREQGRQIRTIGTNDFYIHPHYMPEHFTYDVALLKIPNPIKLSEIVQPVSLIFQVHSHNVLHNTGIVAIGSGSRTKKGVDVLKSTLLQTIHRADCVKHYPVYMFNEHVLCAIPRKDQKYCFGHTDNGGPLILEEGKQLIGIINYSCHVICESKKPHTFTTISPEIFKWISKTMQALSKS